MNKVNVEEREINLGEDSLNDIIVNEKPLHDELDEHIKTRSIKTTKDNLNEIQSITKKKTT